MLDCITSIRRSAGTPAAVTSASVHFECQQQIHAEFDGLARAVGPEQEKSLAHGGEHGPDAFEHFGLAADHEDEFAFFRAPGAAGDRRVEKIGAALGARAGHAPGEIGRHGARIHEHAARAKAIERAGFFRGPLGAPQDLFESGRIAHDGDEDVGLRGGFARAGGELRAGAHEVGGFVLGAIPDHQGKARPPQILSHRPAHQSQPDQTDTRLHARLPRHNKSHYTCGARRMALRSFGGRACG
jgi:hypothetical protein